MTGFVYNRQYCYTHACTHTYTYAHTHTHTHTNLDTHTHTHTNTHLDTHKHLRAGGLKKKFSKREVFRKDLKELTEYSG